MHRLIFCKTVILIFFSQLFFFRQITNIHTIIALVWRKCPGCIQKHIINCVGLDSYFPSKIKFSFNIFCCRSILTCTFSIGFTSDRKTQPISSTHWMQLITEPKTKSVCKRIFSDRRAPCTIHRHLLQIFFISLWMYSDMCSSCVCGERTSISWKMCTTARTHTHTHTDIVFVGSAYTGVLEHHSYAFVLTRMVQSETDTKNAICLFDAVCSVQPCASDAIVVLVACAIPYTDYDERTYRRRE